MTVLRLLTGRKAALRILVINQIIVMICIAMIMVSIVNGCSIIIKWGFLNIILTHCQIITRIQEYNYLQSQCFSILDFMSVDYKQVAQSYDVSIPIIQAFNSNLNFIIFNDMIYTILVLCYFIFEINSNLIIIQALFSSVL